MTALAGVAPNLSDKKSSRAWLRALEMTAPIPRNPRRLLADVIRDLADRRGNAPALLSERECFTYRELVARANQYANWALAQGVRKGDVVGLLMANRPEYFALWLGIAATGGVVALLNTNLSGQALAHCIHVARPTHLIVSAELIDSLVTSMPGGAAEPSIWIHGADHDSFPRIDLVVDELSPLLSAVDRPDLSIDDLALHVFTSGTTGLPKAARISHARILHWSYWFAGMLEIEQEDRTYNCLPMYHSIGGVLVPGAALVAGGSTVIRESFSAGQFWNDVVRWDCTMFQYIGEFCRYLMHTPPSHHDKAHRLRLACGNGLSSDVWRRFQDRFHVPRIVEFYASTEGGLSLFNVEGKPGAIGRVPPYLAHRFAPALVRFDAEKGEPFRNSQGFCVRCAADEPGEALARVLSDPSQAGSRFEGYTDSQASASKLLHDVFKPGDAWVRTGDLMRRDEAGFFYFVDRIGDTFRWKGENVATTEVAEAISAFPGVRHAIVYGVPVAGAEGRIGMAAVAFDGHPNLSGLRRHLFHCLPSYARPAFIRVRSDCATTGTLKYAKADLVKQGYQPGLTSDTIYFDDPETQSFHPVDQTLFERIRTGQIRL
jgi:fatty-acyl-CoA synthase